MNFVQNIPLKICLVNTWCCGIGAAATWGTDSAAAAGTAAPWWLWCPSRTAASLSSYIVDLLLLGSYTTLLCVLIK